MTGESIYSFDLYRICFTALMQLGVPSQRLTYLILTYLTVMISTYPIVSTGDLQIRINFN